MKQTCYARMGPQICQHLKVTTYKLHLLYILASNHNKTKYFMKLHLDSFLSLFLRYFSTQLFYTNMSFQTCVITNHCHSELLPFRKVPIYTTSNTLGQENWQPYLRVVNNLNANAKNILAPLCFLRASYFTLS